MTHDEYTTRPIFPKDQLQHGVYYVGRCRNASVARWNADRQCFFHWREKFGVVFLEAIKHPDDESHFDVFRVLRALPDPPFDIPLDSLEIANFMGDPEVLNAYNSEVWSVVTEETKTQVGSQ